MQHVVPALYSLSMAGNATWCGMGAVYFAIQRSLAVKALVPKHERHGTAFESLVAALPFLGGLNLALSVLGAWGLVRGYRLARADRVVLATVFAIAHASQFAPNVVVAVNGPWQVLKPPMRFIFFMDLYMATVNALMAFKMASDEDQNSRS